MHVLHANKSEVFCFVALLSQLDMSNYFDPAIG